jgi:hypothetical protein
MGVKSLPYQAVSALTVVDEVIKGDPEDESNIFQWVRVILNLPGNQDYDPNLPWVSKVRADGRIAADLFTFVDDLRPAGPGKKEAWMAARRAFSILNWLGLQEAARKRRDSSQQPGAWQGAVVWVTPEGVFVLSDEGKKGSSGASGAAGGRPKRDATQATGTDQGFPDICYAHLSMHGALSYRPPHDD